ncbi:hypothetical protein DCCM_3146 [Desulfocucumis palustris]|uniref:Uncharacterized protein n=1 Tax=Desulfocucumis palustris TaxID=1898651 RepID=A0A2L2XCS7_9FIRM|nr:hypothetical protein DCCM_3146 [Desulfocucumis palustris]
MDLISFFRGNAIIEGGAHNCSGEQGYDGNEKVINHKIPAGREFLFFKNKTAPR